MTDFTALLAVPEVKSADELFELSITQTGTVVDTKSGEMLSYYELKSRLITAIMSARDNQLLDGTVEGKWSVVADLKAPHLAWVVQVNPSYPSSVIRWNGQADDPEVCRAVCSILNLLDQRRDK